MRWLVEIAGDQSHLEALAAAFTEGDLRIEETDAGWVMAGDTINAAASPAEALARATALLPRINGLGQVRLPGFQPVVIEQRVRDADDATVGTAVFGEAHLRIHATLNVGGPPGADLRALDRRTDNDPALAEAIRLLGSGQVDWFVMYKVFEVLRAAAGGEAAFLQRTGISKPELSAFTWSANSPAVSGDGARHSVLPGKANQKPLTLEEGRAFIADIISDWR
jgi:hypothetical protein